MAVLIIAGITVLLAGTQLIVTHRMRQRWRHEHPNEPADRYQPGWPTQDDLENDNGFVSGWPDVSRYRAKKSKRPDSSG